MVTSYRLPITLGLSLTFFTDRQTDGQTVGLVQQKAALCNRVTRDTTWDLSANYGGLADLPGLRTALAVPSGKRLQKCDTVQVMRW